MTEKRIIKKIRRFGEEIFLCEISLNESSVIFHYSEKEKFERLFEKMSEIFEAFLMSNAGDLKCIITLLTDKYASFLCTVKSNDKTVIFPLNYNLETNLFENERKVLREEGIALSQIKKTVVVSGEKYTTPLHFVLRISGGVAIYYRKNDNADEYICFKLRNKDCKK